jgi:hypothetical protein
MNLQVSWIFNVLAKMVYRRSINFLENKHLFKVFLCVELLMINFSFLSFSAICCVKLSFPSCLFFYPLWRETTFNLWQGSRQWHGFTFSVDSCYVLCCCCIFERCCGRGGPGGPGGPGRFWSPHVNLLIVMNTIVA